MGGLDIKGYIIHFLYIPSLFVRAQELKLYAGELSASKHSEKRLTKL